MLLALLEITSLQSRAPLAAPAFAGSSRLCYTEKLKARNTGITAAIREQISELEGLGWYHSIVLPGGQVIPGLQTVEQLKARLAQFAIPEDLTGKRVLDIGAWDGWFTFEMERRGAYVVAIDANPGTNFLRAKALMGSKAEYHVMDVLDLSRGVLGEFDIVLFLGVLYHLKHPLLALEKVCAMSRDLVLVESYVSDAGPSECVPRMEFYELGELCGQFDNWVGPNTLCLLAWCRTAGFAEVTLQSVIDNRAHVTCCRKWGPIGGNRTKAPYIIGIQNATSRDHSFSSTKDEYVSVWFKTGEQNLGVDDVFPSVGIFGSRPVAVTHSGGDGWLVNFKLPLGLDRGWHDAFVRIRDSAPSNILRIGIDNPEAPLPDKRSLTFDRPVITVVADNNTWERNRIRVGPNSCIAVWVVGLVGAAWTENDFEIRMSGTTLPAVFVSQPDEDGAVQINALLPAGVTSGRAEIQAVYRGLLSDPVAVDLI